MTEIRTHKPDTRSEDVIASSCVMDDKFLAQYRVIHRSGLLESDFADTIVAWCIDYYDKYETAPKQQIEDLYYTALRSELSDTKADAIGRFLKRLNDRVNRGDFEHYNTQHAVDIAREHLAYLQQKNLHARIGHALSNRDIKQVEDEIASYTKVDSPGRDTVNPFNDKELIRRAFESRYEPLYEFPGAYGELINEFLQREEFIGIMGPEKRGKTFWLIEHAVRAASCRNNVLFVTLGDMSEEQIVMRLATHLTQKSSREQYCRGHWKPVLDCRRNQRDVCRLRKRRSNVGVIDENGNMYGADEAPAGYVPCSVCHDSPGFEGTHYYEWVPPVEPLIWPEAYKAAQWWWNNVLMHNEFKLMVKPWRGLSATDLDNKLKIMEELEGWVPDVVIIDYADNLAPEPGDGNSTNRDKQCNNWGVMSGLRQKWHCLLVTATQSDADSYESGLLLPHNFSEDKRKYGHATVITGLNQTLAEKDAGMMRRNIVMMREGEFNPHYTVTVLQDLYGGRPCLDSFVTEKA